MVASSRLRARIGGNSGKRIRIELNKESHVGKMNESVFGHRELRTPAAFVWGIAAASQTSASLSWFRRIAGRWTLSPVRKYTEKASSGAEEVCAMIESECTLSAPRFAPDATTTRTGTRLAKLRVPISGASKLRVRALVVDRLRIEGHISSGKRSLRRSPNPSGYDTSLLQ